MLINVLRFDKKDNAAVALAAMQPGDEASIEGNPLGVFAVERIPQGHKIALSTIAEGGEVRKYGHTIGIAKKKISPGEYVHVHNVLDPTSSWKERAPVLFDPAALREIDDSFLLEEKPYLTGYRRKNGLVGFRNYVLVLSTCACANQPVDDLRFEFHGEQRVVGITNPSGCIILPNDRDQQKKMLLGLARNPNVGAVIFVGLGCEAVRADELYGTIKEEKPAAYVILQEELSAEGAGKLISEKVRHFLNMTAEERRVPVGIDAIRLGVQCGASDWTSAAAANPAIGYAGNLVVKNGGISIIGETVGWFGGEELLIRQARTKEAADQMTALMERIYNRCLFYGRKLEEANPSPGNIEGGITTLTEKALGNTMKGGNAPVEGVLEIGEQPSGKGLYAVDNPGLDPASVFGQTMSSCNVILYSTGRGSPIGTPIAPVIKLTASPTAQKQFSAHMDVDLTDMITEGVSLQKGGERLFRKMIEVCNGTPTISEAGGHREYAFPLMMGPM